MAIKAPRTAVLAAASAALMLVVPAARADVPAAAPAPATRGRLTADLPTSGSAPRLERLHLAEGHDQRVANPGSPALRTTSFVVLAVGIIAATAGGAIVLVKASDHELSGWELPALAGVVGLTGGVGFGLFFASRPSFEDPRPSGSPSRTTAVGLGYQTTY